MKQILTNYNSLCSKMILKRKEFTFQLLLLYFFAGPIHDLFSSDLILYQERQGRAKFDQKYARH